MQPLPTVGRTVRYCHRCIMPDTRPRIVFDEEGICNACRHADDKRRIDWDARKAEFLELVAPFRSKSGAWDCIVPWSGGKDSSTIAYRLKFELGMNPLLVTFSPLLPNEVGARNRETLIQLGFDHLRNAVRDSETLLAVAECLGEQLTNPERVRGNALDWNGRPSHLTVSHHARLRHALTRSANGALCRVIGDTRKLRRVASVNMNPVDRILDVPRIRELGNSHRC